MPSLSKIIVGLTEFLCYHILCSIRRNFDKTINIFLNNRYPLDIIVTIKKNMRII